MVHPLALCALLTVFFLLMRGGLEIIMISRGDVGTGTGVEAEVAGAGAGAGAGVPIRDEVVFKLGMATVALGLDRKGSTTAVDSKAKAFTEALCTQYMNDKMNKFTESCNIVASEEQISITLCSSDDNKAPLECEGVERFVDAGEYEIEGGLLTLLLNIRLADILVGQNSSSPWEAVDIRGEDWGR
ncbi:hypothetical protein DFP73DRAFT_611186 [Morchella snyderi]|nr:hypothetical protein DFP73DRAFT_611186 [Morchella snyderi]